MPLNLLKVYNHLLELMGLNPHQRNQSLQGVFQRDIANNPAFRFRGKQINPTKGNEPPMSVLFKHLTTEGRNTDKIKAKYKRRLPEVL